MVKRRISIEKGLLKTLKWEIAEELGLGDIVREQGFGALTTAQSGRIGGLLAARKKKSDGAEV